MTVSALDKTMTPPSSLHAVSSSFVDCKLSCSVVFLSQAGGGPAAECRPGGEASGSHRGSAQRGGKIRTDGAASPGPGAPQQSE